MLNVWNFTSMPLVHHGILLGHRLPNLQFPYLMKVDAAIPHRFTKFGLPVCKLEEKMSVICLLLNPHTKYKSYSKLVGMYNKPQFSITIDGLDSYYIIKLQ
jgi:hypothetical protein